MPIIKGPKSFAAGIAFLALAALFGWSVSSLELGSAARMGPGYFPMLMVVVLAALGVVIGIVGVFRPDDRPEGAGLRGIVLVSGGVAAFAASVESLGLVPAVAIASLMFSLADRDFRLGPALGAAAALAVLSWAVFVEALSMPWPAFGYLIR